ncbi:MAG: carboxypeptidase-like regulatory domain-containing protein [Chitinophagaceae bacterium]
MTNGNNHINYSAADIEKYWKGQLSAAEQHAMEKAALEDPFLADAMEGYEGRSIDSAKDNTDLQKRLANRVAQKKKTSIIPFAWRAAAAVLLLAGAAWLYTSINNKSKNKDLAKNDQLKNANPIILKADTIRGLQENGGADDTMQLLAFEQNKTAPSLVKKPAFIVKQKDSITGAAATAAVPAPAPIILNTTPSAKQENLARKQEEPAASSLAKKETPKSVNDELEQKVQGIVTEDYKTTDKALERRSGNNNVANTFNGKITDQANQPVANAFIQIPNLNVATQTDKKGNFSFRAQDTLLSVSVASDGFETQNLSLHNNARLNQIILKPAQNILNEVVVQSNGAEKRKDDIAKKKDISIKTMDAEPAAGWDAYNEYLEKNKKIPDDVKNIHGSVVVSFEVRSKWMNNFTIEHSLDDALDEEAIRLIKQGPGWKLLKGKKANATVIVKF